MTAHLDPLIAIRPPPSTIVSTFGTLKIHGNRKQWNLHIYCTRTDNNHTQSTAVVSDDDTVVICLLIGTLIQSTFTYEEWIGYDIIFFKILAGLLTCEQKKINSKHNRISNFNFFSSHSLPCFPTNPSELSKYKIVKKFGSNHTVMCQTTVCPPWERKFSWGRVQLNKLS